MGITGASDAATTLPRLLIGFVLSGLIGIVAYRRGSLSRGGMAGTVLVGTVVYGFGNWLPGILLVAFFISSSALSHYKQNNASKKQAAKQFEKGGTRDLGQVLANGGAAVLFSLGFLVLWWMLVQQIAIAKPRALGYPDPASSALWANFFTGNWVALIGALATVNADTWATELGVLSRTPPRSILTLQRVEPGTSGGISLVGTLAGLGGALFISSLLGLISIAASGRVDRGVILLVAVITLGGFAGALFDSLMGATVQAMYYSEARQKATEKSHEADGTPNRLLRGWKWLNNDWVNFISSLVGAGIAAILAVTFLRAFQLII